MGIKEMPFFTRPGFKLKEKGVENLGTDELLAIIFGIGGYGESAIDLSNRLLKKYNLDGLASCSLNELKKECKGDKVKAFKILCLYELIKRYNKIKDGSFKGSITSASDVFKLFKHDFKNEKQEHFIVLLLDTKNKIINYDKRHVTKGLLNSSLIHPREVFKNAIKESAYAIILVHNHPSGDCNPSNEDEKITKRLFEIGNILNIKILDHIIIGKKDFFSFKEDSLLF
jgi:DNA repair protein RadC